MFLLEQQRGDGGGECNRWLIFSLRRAAEEFFSFFLNFFFLGFSSVIACGGSVDLEILPFFVPSKSNARYEMNFVLSISFCEKMELRIY